jgi:hypothetical protein
MSIFLDGEVRATTSNNQQQRSEEGACHARRHCLADASDKAAGLFGQGGSAALHLLPSSYKRGAPTKVPGAQRKAQKACRPSGILERGHRDRRQRLAFIANDGIERLEFGHGFVAERLPLQLAFALAVLALGVYLAVNGGGRFFRAGLFCAPLGVFFVFASLRRGRYLRVVTRRGDRKLHVHGDWRQEEAEQFVNEGAARAVDAGRRGGVLA